MTGTDDRGQVVLLAALVVAVSLVSMAMAYHGLGYVGDVRTTGDIAGEDPTVTAERHLQRGVDSAAVDPPRAWAERNATFRQVRMRLSASTSALQRSGATRRTGYVVAENAAAAEAWTADECPTGSMRAFGPCLSNGGIVVQERANETVLVGVALDVTVRTTSGETTATFHLVAR